MEYGLEKLAFCLEFLGVERWGRCYISILSKACMGNSLFLSREGCLSSTHACFIEIHIMSSTVRRNMQPTDPINLNPSELKFASGMLISQKIWGAMRGDF